MTTVTSVTLRLERELLRAGARLVAGIDEVGRGALCGPATVGVVVVDATTRTAPRGVHDSKLLSAAVRETLAPRIRRWAVASAVGHASPQEVDDLGIVPALRLAGRRALAGLPVMPDVVILDGTHDYLSPPTQQSLLADEDPDDGLGSVPVVRTQVKADLRCAAVAAASILAKTERDAIMVRLAEQHPGYGWATNKGYAAPDHVEALGRLGVTDQHRRSWRLPGVALT